MQLYHARAETILQNLPPPERIIANIGNLSEEVQAWMCIHEMHVELGQEGMSSDDSEADVDGRYVRKMGWRSPEVIGCYAIVDPLRKSMTKWGKLRPGFKPNERKRETGTPSSSRPPPIGKPINLYDSVWYNMLTPFEKQDLMAKPAINIL